MNKINIKLFACFLFFFFLSSEPLTVRTGFPFLQTSFRYMAVHDRLIAAVAPIRANVILRSLAATHAVLVTIFALAIVVILRGRTFWHAERTVSRVFASGAVFRVRSGAGTVALVVAQLAGLLVRLVNSRTIQTIRVRAFLRPWNEVECISVIYTRNESLPSGTRVVYLRSTI